MQTGDLKGNSCENICLWPTLHTLYVHNLGKWILYGLKNYKHTYIGTLRFDVCILDFISFHPQIIRCAVQKYLRVLYFFSYHFGFQSALLDVSI